MIKNRLASCISFLLGPQIWFPLLIVVFLFKTGLTQQQILILFPLVVLFQAVIPFSVFYWFIRTKRITDWDIQKRQERYTILPIFAISTLLALVSIYFFGTQLLFTLSLILWLVVVAGVVITYKWKISLHLLLNTSAVIMINFLFDWNVPILYVSLPLIAWARYHNKHHTMLQIIGGIGVSATIILLSFWYFGYL